MSDARPRLEKGKWKRVRRRVTVPPERWPGLGVRLVPAQDTLGGLGWTPRDGREDRVGRLAGAEL